MFLEKKEHMDGKGNHKIVIGYDLGNETSQISYCYMNSDTPETLSSVAGAESYNIPTVLCKRKEVNQWFYGKEALKYAKEEEGIFIDHLLDLARTGEKVIIENEDIDPVALLSLFMKRSLNLLSMIAPLEKIEAVMITCERLDQKMGEILSRAAAGIGLKTKKVFFQSYIESFYEYILHQPQELWKQQVLMCDYHEDFLKVYRMECNRRTTPAVVFIENNEFPSMAVWELPEWEVGQSRPGKQLDKQFLEIMEKMCSGRFISSVYLIGSQFKEEWMKDSLKFLCKGHRVFQGNNLYSKGACYGMKERLLPSEIGTSHVFLGEEKLKSNIGIKVRRRGMDSYYALLDAGMNWFDAKKECDIILPEENSFEMISTPLNAKEIKQIEISPEGLPQRPPRTTRLRISVSMISPKRVHVRMADMGFGELYPATEMVWEEEFDV